MKKIPTVRSLTRSEPHIRDPTSHRTSKFILGQWPIRFDWAERTRTSGPLLNSTWAQKPFVPLTSLLLSPLPSLRSKGGGGGGGELGGMAMRLAAAAAFVRRLVPARNPVISAEAEAVTCGRGDKKTKRGKRFKGSYGNARPKREKKIERIKDRVEVPRSTPWPLPFKLI